MNGNISEPYLTVLKDILTSLTIGLTSFLINKINSIENKATIKSLKITQFKVVIKLTSTIILFYIQQLIISNTNRDQQKC